MPGQSSLFGFVMDSTDSRKRGFPVRCRVAVLTVLNRYESVTDGHAFEKSIRPRAELPTGRDVTQAIGGG